MSDDILWEMVDLLDMGEVVYLHQTTFDILHHPDPLRWDSSEVRSLTEDVENQVSVSPDAYIRITPPESKEGFYIMEEFTASVQDEKLKQVLTEALHSKKPFRYFRTAVEDSDLLDDWYDYKNAWMMVWLKDKLQLMEMDEEQNENEAN